MLDIVRHRNKIKFVQQKLTKQTLAENETLNQSTPKKTNDETEIEPRNQLEIDLISAEEELTEDDTKKRSHVIDDNEISSLPDVHDQSNKSENLSRRSSHKPTVDTNRDTSYRRHALDPSETKRLRIYGRNRRDSIVQHVIGYNYDDHSTAGGLYTRVGIGSELNRIVQSDSVFI